MALKTGGGIATAPRNQLRTSVLNTINLAYRASRRLRGQSPNSIENILYYPVVEDVQTLSDIANRAAWYLPAGAAGRPSVSIPVANDLKGIDIKSLSAPPDQISYVHRSPNISLIDAGAIDLSRADAIMLWQKKALFRLDLLRHLGKIEIVDPSYYWSVESQLHARIFAKTLGAKERAGLIARSKENFSKLAAEADKFEDGYIFGTGPSLSEAVDFDFSNSFKVVCNSIVKNRSLLKHIRPQLIVFSDPVFHLSPCRYAARFRSELLEAVLEFDLYVMTQEELVPLCLAHLPELAPRLIGMPIRNSGNNLPDMNNFYVKGSTNIMTALMLPIASSFNENIYIVGADGRSKNERYFWKHESQTQFNDLMSSAFATHPSFFRDRIYADYYREHCRRLDELVAYGETLGKRYIALTRSQIPALARRPAEKKGLDGNPKIQA